MIRHIEINKKQTPFGEFITDMIIKQRLLQAYAWMLGFSDLEVIDMKHDWCIDDDKWKDTVIIGNSNCDLF